MATDAAAPATAMPVQGGGRTVGRRGMSRQQLATLAAVVVVAAAGYWWLHRSPAEWKRDNSGLYPIKIEGKFGFMDRSGKTVIAPQFDQTEGFSEGLAAVRIGTKVGYINTKGALVITPQFDSGRPFMHGRASVQIGNQYGFIDTDGRFICTPTFQWAYAFSGDGNLAPVQTADNQGAFVDRAGQLVLAGKFKRVLSFTGGLAPATSDGDKWGYIDEKGNWVIDPQFELALPFREGLAAVKVGGRIGYIDAKGKFIVNPQFEQGDMFSEGRARVRTADGNGFIDTKGGAVGETKFLGALAFNDGLAPVRTSEGWGYIDAAGKMIVVPELERAETFQNGLALVTVGGKQAYVTTSGVFVTYEPGFNPDAALQQVKQKHTLADIRKVGTAMFSWLTDQVGAAAAGQTTTAYDVSLEPVIGSEDLSTVLVSQYIQSVPALDGWEHPYEYRLNVKSVTGKQVMAIRSAGRDGKFAGNVYTLTGFDPTDYDQDIVWADGYFVRAPRVAEH
ncbi:MAG TPA: WG repeat-containing protein [Thermoanaerobaculia bacterium]|nr:WG repeat-containing protein [Thermoanaerobaculia bacterium]